MELNPDLLMAPPCLTSVYLLPLQYFPFSSLLHFPIISNLGNFRHHDLFPPTGTPKFVFRVNSKTLVLLCYSKQKFPLLPQPLNHQFLESIPSFKTVPEDGLRIED